MWVDRKRRGFGQYLVVLALAIIQIGYWAKQADPNFARDITLSSNTLLFHKDSPLRSFLDNSASNEPVRTEAQLRTPVTPFGVGLDTSSEPQSITHIVKSGETLGSIVQRYGGNQDDVTAISDAIDEAAGKEKGTSQLRAGEELVLVKSSDQIKRIERHLPGAKDLIVEAGPAQTYLASVHEPVVTQVEQRITGVVTSSFAEAAREQEIPYSLVDDFVDLFSDRVEFNKDFQPGDTFSLIYTEKRADDGEVVGVGKIRAASIELGDKFYAAAGTLDDRGVMHYYNERGEMPGDYFLRYPLQFSRISSVFTTARFHPVLNISRPHHGVDFAAPTGTPVRSIGGGVVIFAGYGSATGNVVRIQHNDRYTTEYMHLSKINAAIKKGTRVERGQMIGAVGMTGLATGPHLHFGLFDKGDYVDPLKAKLFNVPAGGKAPSIVLAMLEDLKHNHSSVEFASNNSNTKRRA